MIWMKWPSIIKFIFNSTRVLQRNAFKWWLLHITVLIYSRIQNYPGEPCNPFKPTSTSIDYAIPSGIHSVTLLNTFSAIWSAITTRVLTIYLWKTLQTRWCKLVQNLNLLFDWHYFVQFIIANVFTDILWALSNF